MNADVFTLHFRILKINSIYLKKLGSTSIIVYWVYIRRLVTACPKFNKDLAGVKL